MPTNEIIVNGSFSQGSLGWNGNDLETSYAENAYLGNGSGNRVAEIDGVTGQTTVMQQDITVGSGFTTDLTFRVALRTASQSNAGNEGFTIEILDSTGAVVAGQTITPTSQAWTSVTLPVTFPQAGTYTVRFTEIGPDDSLGAIVDDVSMLVCFAASCRILTDRGPRAAGRLAPGDRIWTLDAGFLPLRWIGRRHVTAAQMAADPSLRPVAFAPGSLGPGVPDRRMLLSPQHRVMVRDWRSEVYFGLAEALVPAASLIDGDRVRSVQPRGGVTYVHFLLDGHQIVRSDGVLTESFHPNTLSLRGLDHSARAEILRLFPSQDALQRAYPVAARPVLRRAEARFMAAGLLAG